MKHSDVNWAKMIEMGKKLVGKPYVFGAEINLDSPPEAIKAIDCSELSEYLFFNAKTIEGLNANIDLPDGSYNQAKMCRRLSFRAAPSQSDVLLIGDLGFKWNPDTEVIHHVGIFIGEGMVLEAKGKLWGVCLSDFNSYTHSNHFAYWGRHKLIQDA